MPYQSSKTRPVDPVSGARPRSRLLLASLGIILLAFLISLPWQIRNWREASALRQDVTRQQARVRQLQQLRDDRRRAEDALRAAPADPNAQLGIATELARNGDFTGAATYLRGLEPAAGHSAEMADAVAGLYQQIGYIDRAVALARQGVRLAPDSPQALLRLAVLDTEIGWQPQAHALLDRAVSLAPDAPEIHIALALDNAQTGGLAEAMKELATARRLRPGDWRTLALLADNLHAQTRDAEALPVIAEALVLAPQEPSLYARQAAFLLEQARVGGGKTDTAPVIQAARRCLSLDPDNAAAHDTLGQVNQDAGASGDARREWERAYALNPGCPGLRFHLGRLLLSQGDSVRGRQLLAEDQRATEEAAAWNRLVILAGTTPNDPNRHRQAARWCQAHHRVSRAIFEWQEVLARLPQDAEARQSAARLLAARG